jgi:hypothetical protein
MRAKGWENSGNVFPSYRPTMPFEMSQKSPLHGSNSPLIYNLFIYNGLDEVGKAATKMSPKPASRSVAANLLFSFGDRLALPVRARTNVAAPDPVPRRNASP